MKKKCVICRGPLGLATRFRNLWNGFGWTHVRFCGPTCEQRFEKDKRDAIDKLRWHHYLARGSPSTGR